MPRLLTVPTHLETGLDVGAVEHLLAAGARPALLYAMSDGHNPVGASMPHEARRRLVALARSHGVPILEDDAYGMLGYDGEEPPALRAFDAEWVFYLGSFSKTLAPALRTGWVVVPERFMGPLASLKESSDIDTATLGQRAVAAVIASGAFEDHLARLRIEYARRRDTLLGALERELPPGARWSRPRAGFFTWVELPEGVDAIRLFEIALRRERVAFVPGAAFAAGDATPARSALRLNFSFSPPDLLEEGVARIARALAGMSETRAAGESHA
jgi:2-aminoadipate transaminase